jgi:hypothetical protein
MQTILDAGASRDETREMSEEFSEELINEIFNTKELNELDQIDILRQIEVQALQMLDDYYQDHANGDHYED